MNTTELMTKSVKDLIAEHNAMPNAKKILGDWHDSKAKLVTRMVKLDEANEATKPKANGAAKPKKVKPEPKGTHSSLIGDYCAKHDLNPRQVRAKLRKLGKHAPYKQADLDLVKG
jgi:hypothetical protein